MATFMAGEIMTGRIVTIQGSPEALAQAQQTIASQGQAILRGLAGLQSLHIMFQANAGRAAVVTTWKDAQSAQAARGAMEVIRQKLSANGLSIKIEDYDSVS